MRRVNASPVSRPRALAFGALVLSLAACTPADGPATPSPTDSPTASASASASASTSPSATPTATETATSTPTTATPSPTATTTRPPAQVGVTITYAATRADGDLIVGAYADVVTEGTCTLTLSGPGNTITASSSAIPDVTTSACGEIVVSADQLVAGTWNAVVDFAGGAYAGTSDPYQVEVG